MHRPNTVPLPTVNESSTRHKIHKHRVPIKSYPSAELPEVAREPGAGLDLPLCGKRVHCRENVSHLTPTPLKLGTELGMNLIDRSTCPPWFVA